jgi:hypothetical protein
MDPGPALSEGDFQHGGDSRCLRKSDKKECICRFKRFGLSQDRHRMDEMFGGGAECERSGKDAWN